MFEIEQTLWLPILVAVTVAVIVAVAGGIATDIGPWYVALKKPSWQPPNWLFGPVWTTIFTLAVVAAVMGWQRAQGSQDQTLIIALFAVNAVLNILWSVLFFTLRRPDWAMIEVLMLWASILALMVFFWRFSPWSSLLLAPYIVWVSIASYLNLTIIRLNGPFGSVA
jgi:translocator protein